MSGAAPKQAQRSEGPAPAPAAAAERATAIPGINNQLMQAFGRGFAAAGGGSASEGAPAPGLNMAMARAGGPSADRPEGMVRQQLAKHAGGGEALPASLRAPAERSLEADLGHVRLHRGEGARDVTVAAGARAAQWRNHIFVRPDLYAPQSAEGRKLIGHELVHAGQRLGGASEAKMLSGRSDPAEAEADRLRVAALSGVPGAARTSRSPSAAVSLDPLTDDPGDVSALPPQVCDPNTWDGDGETTIGEEAPAEDDPGLGYGTDPLLIDVTILTNEELILQDIEAGQMIASFISTDQETEDWLQLQRDIAAERAFRVEQGFVFMAVARDAVPTELFQLAPGPLAGTTGIYVAFPEVALGDPRVSTEGVILNMDQLSAYLQAAGMMEVGGDEASEVIEILQAGDGARLAEHFAAPPPIDLGPTSGHLGPNVAATGMMRNRPATDLVTYGQPHWQLPIDAHGIRAVGTTGEASFWTSGNAAWSPYAFDLNAPGHSWVNMLGQPQTGNSPIADFMVGNRQVIDGPLAGIPFSNAATSQADQARATRFLMQKFAIMLDVAGRTGASGSAPQTVAAAEAHVRQMAGDSALAIGTPEFAAAQRQFLSDTMFSVPRARLAEIRSTVGQPFETRDGGRRPAMLEGYRALYNEALRAAPIQATVGGATVTIASYNDLVRYLPNSLRTGAEQTPGGPGAAMTMSPAERTRVFDLMGRMAASRVIATEDAGNMIASSDTLRAVGLPGVTEQGTRVLPMDIGDFADTGRRIREGLADPRTADSAGQYRWRTAESASQADAYLSFIRMLSGNQGLTRDDPDFARLRAAVTRDIVLSMPSDQQMPLMDAILTSDAALAQDIRAAIAVDNPGINVEGDLGPLLRRQTTTFDLTTPELEGTRRYAVDLHARYGLDASSHLSADALTLHQQPGFEGMRTRAGRGVGHSLWSNALGYGITAGLDSATGRDVQLPSAGQIGLDLAVSLGSDEAERQIGGRLLSRVAIQNAAARGLFQRATPGFVLQPVVSGVMEEISLSSDEDLYAQMGIEMTDDERSARRIHALGVGATGAVASAGALYVIGSFTAGGAAAGAPAAGVGAAPGALVGFLVGVGVVAVGAVAAYAADRNLPGGREEFMRQHEETLRERARVEQERRDAIRSGVLPMHTFEGSQVPLPFRISPDISLQEQAIIASYLMANARR